MISLPDPADIQVATGIPEVEAFRAALWRAVELRKRLATRRAEYDETCRRVSASTPRGREICAREFGRYWDLVNESDDAETTLHEAETAAAKVAPDAARRFLLSVKAYSERLRTELANRRDRY